MLDTIGTIACTVVYVAQVGVLTGFAAATRAARRAAIVAALLWAGVVGVLAIPLALLAARSASWHRGLIAAWNTLAILDLVMAIVLAALSSPGVPFRVFMGGEGTLAMAGLPWVMVPALLVPVYFLVHRVIAAKVKAIQPSTGAISMAHAH